MPEGLEIAFFGSSLVSSWWNGAATYYRGLVRGLHALGHRVTFYEPAAFGRQEHRDIDDPKYAEVVVYPAESAAQVRAVVERAACADVVVKASGVGVFDSVLEEAVADAGEAGTVRIFWDVDAPATLAVLEAGQGQPLRSVLDRFDVVLTYGGGEPVVRRYLALGARNCVTVYNGLDPATHHRVAPDPNLSADCALLANRLPDREDRIDEFFFRAARLAPRCRFVLGGNGWEDKTLPPNVRRVGHVPTADHNRFNCSARTVLNVTREAMAAVGWSPPTRVFEAAGAGACLITDRWLGIEAFFEPARELLVARDGREVADLLATTSPAGAAAIGRRAEQRARAEHTYAQRAALVDRLLRSRVALAR